MMLTNKHRYTCSSPHSWATPRYSFINIQELGVARDIAVMHLLCYSHAFILLCIFCTLLETEARPINRGSQVNTAEI